MNFKIVIISVTTVLKSDSNVGVNKTDENVHIEISHSDVAVYI